MIGKILLHRYISVRFYIYFLPRVGEFYSIMRNEFIRSFCAKYFIILTGFIFSLGRGRGEKCVRGEKDNLYVRAMLH